VDVKNLKKLYESPGFTNYADYLKYHRCFVLYLAVTVTSKQLQYAYMDDPLYRGCNGVSLSIRICG